MAHRAQQLRALRERIARLLAPVLERGARERAVIAALLDEPAREAEVDELDERIDPRAVADLELRLSERRRALVLRALPRGVHADAQIHAGPTFAWRRDAVLPLSDERRSRWRRPNALRKRHQRSTNPSVFKRSSWFTGHSTGTVS